MDYCAPRGIPHSTFMEWDEEDQAKALAYEREMATVCSSCGTRQVEWDEDRFAYVAESVRCPGCELREQERENVNSQLKEVEGSLKGVHVVLVPNPVPKAAR